MSFLDTLKNLTSYYEKYETETTINNKTQKYSYEIKVKDGFLYITANNKTKKYKLADLTNKQLEEIRATNLINRENSRKRLT